jgi:hypothetical protein
MSNVSMNSAAVNKFRNELKAMCGDISQIDKKVLNLAVNVGLTDVKNNTPVGEYSNIVDFTTDAGEHVHFETSFVQIGGTLKKAWHATPTVQTGNGVEKSLVNNTEYASYVNDGHRTVTKDGVTLGFVEGKHMLEKAKSTVKEAMKIEFEAEVRRVQQRHDS